MNVEPWLIAIITAAGMGIGGLIWLIRLEGTVKSHDNSKAEAVELTALKVEVDQLKKQAEAHSDTRDLVVELRAEVRSLKEALGTFTESMRDAVRELTAQIGSRPRTVKRP